MRLNRPKPPARPVFIEKVALGCLSRMPSEMPNFCAFRSTAKPLVFPTFMPRITPRPMQTPINALLALGPLGKWELVVVFVLIAVALAPVAFVVWLVMFLVKKSNRQQPPSLPDEKDKSGPSSQ